MKLALTLALLCGSAVAFTPVRHNARLPVVRRMAEEAPAEPAAESTEEAAPAEEEAAPAPAPAPAAPKMTATQYMETMYGGLGEPETMGKIPPLAYNVAELGTPATMDFMRAAELKHGRIAMMGYMGWVAHLQGVHFPGMLSTSEGISFEALDKISPVVALFDRVPASGIGQIFAFIAIFEWYEMTHKDGKYVGNNVLNGALVPNVNKWDILGFTEGKSEDDLKRVKLQELKNGRMAMIGVLGCIAAQTIPNSVPVLAPFFQ